LKKITGAERTLRIVFGLQFGVLVAIVAVTFTGVHRLIGEAAWVAHTHEVITVVCQSLIDHSVIKVNSRSYLLIGEERLIDDMRKAEERVSLDLHKVEVLTRDNPTQQGNIASYRRALMSHMVLTEQIIRSHVEGDRQSELRPFYDGRIEAATKSVVDTVEVILTEERRLLSDRKDKMSIIVNAIYKAAPFLAVAELASVILVYVLINKVCYKGE
jgi:CHASE3 domain sensor protein